MRLALMLEPQVGMTYADILAAARRAQAAGLDGCFRSDHYKDPGHDEAPSTDAWATLAGLAVQTERIQIGTLVTPATFRTVGNLAKVVATVAEMAGAAPDGRARVELGLGTGWMEVEHTQLGFPFEDLSRRYRRLEEHLAVITALWDPERAPLDFDGEFVRLRGARFVPVPQPRPNVIVGGKGMRRTPALAARYADELNGVYLSPQRCAEQRAALARACREADRDPAAVRYSLMTGCLVGRTADDVRARSRRLQERSGDDRPVDDYLDSLRGEWVVGTYDEARRRLAALADAGVERVMLQHQAFDDLDMVDEIGEHLLG